ncbi:COPII coat assembly protein sec-16 [Metarhizium anisopliae]
MAAEPAASWHPAMRPNSAADIVVPSDKSEAASSTDSNAAARQRTQSEEHDATESWFDNGHENEDEANAWLISEDTEPAKPIDPAQPTDPLQSTEAAEVTGLAETHTQKEQQKSEDAAIAWLTNGDDGDGGAKLLSDKGGHSPSAKEPELTSQDDHADGAPAFEPLNKEQARPEVDEAKETKHVAKGPSSTMAQHSSSMSFARTVSHEITFGDDDDGEWILGRSDTDTFGFMPPSDRTNSFPVVPPISSSCEPNDALPLPPNQALDVMEEDEREAEVEEDEYMMQSPEGDSSASWHRHVATRRNHAPSRSIGGEIADVAPTAAASRFEEGIPLIPRREEEGETPEAIPDLFADEEANEDDFFSQVQNNDWDSNAKPLERKSTMQVMAAMNDAGPFSRQSTVEEETIEEHADESAEGVALGVSETIEPAPATDDLTSKWEQAFGGDDNDDFLLDDPTVENKDIDAAAFLGSDDEGLLDDVLDEPVPAIQTSQPQKPAANPYASINSAAHSSTPYNATAATAVSAQYPSMIPYGGTPVHYGQTPALPQPEATKAQSFADKSKAGYASPYDLPTELVTKTAKPRKRPSLQHIPPERAPPPPRSASMYSPGQVTPGASAVPASSAPPALAGQPPLGLATETTEKAPAPALRPKGGFFEELPISSKPRPASRQSQRAPSPGPYAPGPPQHGPPPPSRTVPALASTVNQPPAAQHSAGETQTTPGMAGLVAPPRVNPYSTLQSQSPSVTPPSSSSSRYSPAPTAQQGGGVSLSSRYSPAPSAGSRPNSSYGTGSSHNLPHLPRTSSPLAHFESSGTTDGQHHDRRTSSSFEPRLNRVSSLPPTREVDEEEDEEAVSPGNRSVSANHAAAADIAESRYSPASPVCTARYTPSLPSTTNRPAAALSPTKRTNSYAPQPVTSSAQASFAPPPRAQTQSPGAMQNVGRKGSKSSESGPRPSSSHASTAPTMVKPAQSAYTPITRARGQSLTNLLPPTDGREHDPLERWKGAPVMSWGVGGTFVTTFPKSIPRYAIGQSTPVTVRTVGEVKVQNIKDLDPLQDHLAKFPGPLKGKSKKKEAISWLSAGIESMEKELPDVTFQSHLSLEDKRSIERLLLWKLLRVFIEHDGVLEGSPTVDKSVREVLTPETIGMQSEGAPLFTAADTTTAVTSMQADGVDSGAVEKIRLDLLKGDRETAVWAAVDKRLWGHAMIISQTVSSDLYKRVAQEFVRKEVNYPGHNNESLAALYKVLSGNYDDCVDELVPSHARAGLQLVSTENSSGPTKDATEGLDKWRETLTLVLSNRSNDDVRGLNALGKLLSSYGRAEAAHICFIFSRQLSVFGGLDDPKADFVLLGSDHHKQSDQFAKETEALQLSEVYEYGLTLAGGVTATAGAPHLAAYKLQHAVTLAEYGYRDRALQYCDAIASAIVSQTRRSAYHHPILEGAVEDFLARLKQAPKEASSSWISKPTMGKVSDSMWNRFNKFVSGDEDGNGQTGSDGDNGPFARIASSPNNSRPPSTSNFDVYAASPSFPSASAPPAAGAAATRYAPVPTAQFPTSHANPYVPAAQGQHVPLPNSTGSAQRYAPNPFEASYSGAPPAQPQTDGYQPVSYPEAAATSGHQPVESAATHTQQQPAPAVRAAASAGYRPYSLQESPNIQPQPGADDADQGYQPPSYGYEPPQIVPVPVANDAQGTGDNSGYEPPSFQPHGYEPPSYQAHVEGDDAPKPKKKGFMEDDDEDIPTQGQPQERSKAEKDRENEKMFRKAAEEDAKRAASAASAKKGWGFGGWFGGGKKPEVNIGEAQAGKAIKAKLGEQSSFVYDPDLKRWINKKPGAENVETKKAAPPPPRGAPRTLSGTPPPAAPGTPPPAAGRSSVPPMPFRSTAGRLTTAQSMENLSGASAMGAPPTGLSRSVSSNNTTSAPPSTGPPSRPATSMSNASSIDDLLGAPGPRKAGQKKARKSGRYVDVMAK